MSGGPPAANATLREVVSRLVETLHPDRILLFGSRSRGDATADSDYDLLVVIEGAERPYRLEQRALSALADVDLPVDVLLIDRDRFERQQGVVASLAATATREGLLLCAA